MKITYKMKEATNTTEAITSILDVIKQNPLFLNKCTSDLFIITKTLYTTNEKRKDFLNSLNFEQVKNLFIEIKKEYYHFKDVTKYNY